MKHILLTLSLLVLGCCFASCSKSEYDTSEGIDREMTLFGEEIYVPIGQIGPVTVKSLLSSNTTIENVVKTLMKEDSDGVFYIESEDPLYSMNAYRQVLNIPDPSLPFHWDIGTRYGSVAPMAALLKMANMSFTDQHLTIYATNPLTTSLVLNTDIWVRCRDNAYAETFSKEFDLADYSLQSSYSPIPLVRLDLPADVTDLVSSVELNDLTLDLPADAADMIRPSDDAKFSFYVKFKSKIAPSEKFSFAQAIPISDLNVPLGKFKLHKCQLAFDLENTLPLDITVKSIRLRDENGEDIPDVVFSSDIKISGGKPGAPAVTPVLLQVEALTGTIPDLREIVVDLKIEYSGNTGMTPLSSAMSLSLKSASVKLFGGITLFGK